MRFVTTIVLFTVLLMGVAAHPAQATPAPPPVTIGFLPLTTKQHEIMIRGSAPTGTLVTLQVNGADAGQARAATDMAVYRLTVPLRPGWNEIVATAAGGPPARAGIYLVTRAFRDTASEELREDIEILATLGIVHGDEENRFRPMAPLTRAELAKLMVLALDLRTPEPPVTLGVTDQAAVADWARPYLAAAMEAGLLRGYPDGSVQPRRTVTRGELVVIALRALPDAPAVTAELPYRDRTAIPAWVVPAAEQAQALRLIDRFWGDRFRASEAVSRAEAAAVIRRLIDLRRTLPSTAP